ncbi:MAG TPA: DUF2314 domain-containing protein [Steroidobacteraceae bacterium]|nr:DUF2314 domain-containing protein [Steroidobacteraceae bacterium]
MKHKFVWASLLLISLAACSGGRDDVIKREGEPDFTAIGEDDAEMNAAMSRGRSTLDEFEQRLASPPASQGYIAIKGRFEEDGSVEHIWLDDVAVLPEGYRGKVGNTPVYITRLAPGQEVIVSRADVSDWMAVDDGKLVGGYTIRVLRDRLSDAERAEFDASTGFKVE